MMASKKSFVLFGIGIAAIFFAIGILIGTFGINTPSQRMAREDVGQTLLNEIKAANINNNLRILSSVPHLAGTEQDLEQANWVRDRFLEGGLDEVQVVPYRVLLSYPDFQNPNKVHLLNGTAVVYSTSGRQTPLREPEEGDSRVAPNFNAYSATGTARGKLVYAYYGREEDYDHLESQGINVSGKIVLARYGSVFRGNIVRSAEKRGAAGVLIFSDPQDFAQQGRNSTYPDNWWMPGMGVQSGTVYLDNGDPLTPFYPSLESAYRIPEKDASLPRIPVQPIGYDEAEVFLRSLTGSAASPAAWRGALNATYDLGPSPDGSTVELDIKTSNQIATTYNTIGFLYGEEEPDRYVIMGNHRDAWILGSVDPSSGTASMLELARAFGTLKTSKHWRPRRTLVFCSWGAEEYGLIGSYEWVEEHAKVLSQRAVAYLNVDIAVEGNVAFRGKAVPMMRSALMDAAKMVPNPNPEEMALGRTTVFDTWVHTFPSSNDSTLPEISGMGSGSDFTPFIHYLGIPCVDLRYTYKEEVNSYPLYHTLYETHYLMNIVDPGFVHHQAVTQMWGQLALSLADNLILPLNITYYATYLQQELAHLKVRYEDKLDNNNASLRYFEQAVHKFSQAATQYTDTVLSNVDQNTGNSLLARRINDQLMQVERGFIDTRGLPNRPQFNHIVFAPSSSDNYASSSFAGLTDLMETVGNQTETQQPELWAKIKHHLAAIVFFVDATATSLKDGL